MNALHIASLVVAQKSAPPLEAGEPAALLAWSGVLTVLSLTALAGVVLYFAARYFVNGENRRFSNPSRLFAELCRAHQLNRGARRLLRQLALAHRLEQPALLFLEPERFDAAQLDGSWRKLRPRLEELRDSIFARRLNDHAA